MRKHLLFFGLLIVIGVIMQSCLDDKLDFDNVDTKSELNVKGAFPLIKGSVNLKDIVEEDDNFVFKKDASGDELLTIVFSEDELFSFSVDEVVEIPDVEEEGEIFNLDPISYDNINTAPVEVGLNQFAAATNLGGSYSDGYTGAIPAMSINEPIDAASNYELVEGASRLEVHSGKLKLYVRNDYPFDVTNVEVQLINSEQQEVFLITYPSIPKDQTKVDSVDLGGKTITSGMEVKILSMSTPGRGVGDPVDLDQDKLVIWSEIIDLEVRSGTANLFGKEIEHIDTMQIEINKSEDENQVVKYVKLGDVDLNYYLSTGFGVPFKITYWSDCLIEDKNGNNKIDAEERAKDTLVSSFTFNNQGEVSATVPLDNYIVDLTSEGSNGNKFAIYYKLELEPEDNYVDFETDQDVTFRFQLQKLNNWVFVQGDFFNTEIEIPPYDEELGIDFLDDIDAELRLNDPKIRLPYHNSLGLTVSLNAVLSGKNGAETKKLNLDKKIEQPSTPGDVLRDTILIDKGDGLADLVSLPPRKILFEGNAVVNEPNGEDHFLTKDSEIKMGLELEMPLDITVKNLIISDTTSLSMGDVDVNEALLVLKTKNGFPFSCVVDIVIRDSASQAGVNIDELKNVTLLKMPEVDANGHATKPTEYQRTEIVADEDFLKALSETANQLIFRVSVNMPENGAKIYSSYSIDYMISGKGSVDVEIDSGDEE